MTCLSSLPASVPSSILNSASPLWSHLDECILLFANMIGELRNTKYPPQLHRLHLLPLLLLHHLGPLLPHQHWQLKLHLVLIGRFVLNILQTIYLSSNLTVFVGFISVEVELKEPKDG